jgi:hypothetical protein
MQSLRATADIVRRIGLLALLGFGVVVLAGPILAVLSVVLSFALVIGSFALVGLLAWGAFQFALHGQQVAWQNIRALGQNLGRHAFTLGQGLGRVLAFIPRSVGLILTGVLFVVVLVWRMAWTLVRVFAEVAFLALCGLGVGAFVGAAGWLPNQDPNMTVPVCALLGAAIAALVGAVLALLPRKTSLAAR